ncbi:hypothetical protein PBY51_010336 [Eleginops maclovinus]|uniref:Uncharacterized protein n=1 Tax=Eleginops maclovinus TaxID=56733 RepID=A0AAN8AI93_ELEMC|nr:hypothetical protein PBY51_010336 [Eleginops maclovinus]
MCLCLHERATVLPEGRCVPHGWFLSLTEDWLQTEGRSASQQPLSDVRGDDGSQSTGESQHFHPLPTPPAWPACREKSQRCSQQEGLKHLAGASARKHIQGRAGRVSERSHCSRLHGLCSNDRVCVCYPCASEEICNVMSSEEKKKS